MKKPNLLKHLATLIGRWFKRAPKKQAMPQDVTGQEDQTMDNHNDGLVPYDENLLEHARTQWQFGDWDSLIKIERETLQHHPDRAKLALLAAAGHLQQGDNNTARQFTRLALDWGCSKKLVSQILIAGVHNSLGRAAAINGEGQRALQHFESAIAAGSPAGEVRLLTKARLGEQLAQLGLSEKLKINASETSQTLPKRLPTLSYALEELSQAQKQQHIEFNAQLAKQSEALLQARKALESDLKREVLGSTKQIEAFLGLQNYFNTGDLPVEMHGWPISPDFGLYLIERLETNNYNLVIEFGSGTSTVVIAKALAKMASRFRVKPDVVQIAFEHLAQYHTKTLDSLQQAGLANALQLILAPLQPYSAANGNSYAYYSCHDTLDKLTKNNNPADLCILVVVDGPPGSTNKHARYPALPVILNYFAGAQIDILLDDYYRDEEKEITKMWLTEAKAAGLNATLTELKFEKGACLISLGRSV